MGEALSNAVGLLKEVREWHSDPESVDYNWCDVDPCQWCVEADKVINADQRGG